MDGSRGLVLESAVSARHLCSEELCDGVGGEGEPREQEGKRPVEKD